MSNTISTTALPTQIQQLLEQRQEHADAISRIDKTLAGVMSVLTKAKKLKRVPLPGKGVLGSTYSVA